MKIFITGSAGFIGSCLQKKLTEKKYLVRGYDIRSKAKDDVRDYKRLALAIRRFQPDGIVHLAAVSRVEEGFLDPQKCVEVNVGGVANVLEAIRKTPSGQRPWLIFGSSREVFGEPKFLPVVESSPKNAINVYGVTKLTGEMLLKNYADNYGVKAWVVRFSNVYTGINDRQKRAIPRFISRALAGKSLTINGGKQIFDFVYIGDTIEALMKCIRKIRSASRLFDDFNFTTGRKMSIVNLAKLIVKLTGSKSKIIFNEPRQYDVNVFWGNPEKSKKILGWEAKYDLRRGLKEVIPELRHNA